MPWIVPLPAGGRQWEFRDATGELLAWWCRLASEGATMVMEAAADDARPGPGSEDREKAETIRKVSGRGQSAISIDRLLAFNSRI